MNRTQIKLIPVHLVLVLVFGVLLPWRKGIDFLDPVMISAYACLGVLFAGPAAAFRFGQDRPQSMKEAFRRVGQAVAYGEAMAVILLIAGVITVNYSRTRWEFPQLDVLGEALVFGLASAVALALFAGWMSLRFSARAARTSLRAIFLIGVVSLFYFPARLPEITVLPGLPLALAIAAGMTWLLRREVCP